jgi:hypothetical protein
LHVFLALPLGHNQAAAAGTGRRSTLVEVRWPDVSSTRLPDVAADRVVAIEQTGR